MKVGKGWQRTAAYLEAGNIFDLAECLDFAFSTLWLCITKEREMAVN
jgi:hypothetical protein